MIAFPHEQTESLAAVTALLSVFLVITLSCALFFPNREEELRLELLGVAAE